MRWLAVLAVAVTMAGCATGVEDPQPVPAPDEPQRDPPKQIKSGVFENPYDNIQVPLGSYQLPPDEPTLQTPRLPSR